VDVIRLKEPYVYLSPGTWVTHMTVGLLWRLFEGADVEAPVRGVL
jgi:hypothetical protein